MERGKKSMSSRYVGDLIGDFKNDLFHNFSRAKIRKNYGYYMYFNVRFEAYYDAIIVYMAILFNFFFEFFI